MKLLPIVEEIDLVTGRRPQVNATNDKYPECVEV